MGETLDESIEWTLEGECNAGNPAQTTQLQHGDKLAVRGENASLTSLVPRSQAVAMPERHEIMSIRGLTKERTDSTVDENDDDENRLRRPSFDMDDSSQDSSTYSRYEIIFINKWRRKPTEALSPDEKKRRLKRNRLFSCLGLLVSIMAACLATVMFYYYHKAKSQTRSITANAAVLEQQPGSSTMIPSQTVMPSDFLSTIADEEMQVTTFIALGDAPYSSEQAETLKDQMDEIDYSDVEFVVHVGDFRHDDGKECLLDEYERGAAILRRSPKPVFVLPGDNDYVDCDSVEEGWQYYSDTFFFFDSRYWNHTFQVKRLVTRPETFTFIHKGTLFIGLNIVAYSNSVSDRDWANQLTEQLEWTKRVIMEYKSDLPENRNVGRVVIFAHADPHKKHHADFFEPLALFIEEDLMNSIPILYVNGDFHEWSYDDNYYGQSSFLRIMVPGETKEPPVLLKVHSDGQWQDTADAFIYDRRLQ